MSKYIVIYNDNDFEINCDYITRRYATSFIENYKSYIFKFKNDLDILYINHPLKDYYRNNRINDLENPTEERLLSYTYLEVRLTPKFPYLRLGTNIGSL
jgi:hypothetical protein